MESVAFWVGVAAVVQPDLKPLDAFFEAPLLTEVEMFAVANVDAALTKKKSGFGSGVGRAAGVNDYGVVNREVLLRTETTREVIFET
jgi:hypothetical protein